MYGLDQYRTAVQVCSYFTPVSCVTCSVSIRFAWATASTTIHDISWDFSDKQAGHRLTISVGDKVRFQYATPEHDVVEVTKSQFTKCDITGIISPSSGFGSKGPGGTDAIELSPAFEQPGIRYFICSLRGHCLAGIKLRVDTVSAQKSPTTFREIKLVACPNCGTKDGKLSCCAPGGSWFRKCGNGDKFDHTWFEGVQACKSKPIQHVSLELDLD